MKNLDDPLDWFKIRSSISSIFLDLTTATLLESDLLLLNNLESTASNSDPRVEN